MSVIENSLAAGLKAFTTYNRNKKRVMQMNDPIGPVSSSIWSP